jgi:hypothetical protein
MSARLGLIKLRLLLGALAFACLGFFTVTSAASASAAVASAASTEFSLSPANIRAAYGLPKTGAPHQTIAVVSALGDPSVAADLNAYSKRFGIPPCTVANHCFRVLNEDGAASPLPAADQSGVWLTESSVGVEVARGICQSCSIMLVEARSPSKFDVSTAVNTAAKLGATVVETAFEDAPAPDDTQFASDYSHPGTVVVAASGDAGYTSLVFFPATMPSVLAVGGTHLDLTPGGQYQDEFAWEATTTGCSPYDDAAPWQKPFAVSVGCGSQRVISDLAAVADPGMLVHVQDVGSPCGNVFCEADGTSVSAPIIAGMIGLAGSLGSNESKLIYAHARSEHNVFRDVRIGVVQGCRNTPVCRVRRGFDGPTGLGTPYGLAAFLQSGGALDPRHPQFGVTGTNGQLRTTNRWMTHLGVQSHNPFALTVNVTLWSGRRMLGSTRVTLGPEASSAVSIKVVSRYRTLLKSLGTIRARAIATGRGPAGRSVNVAKSLKLHAP